MNLKEILGKTNQKTTKVLFLQDGQPLVSIMLEINRQIFLN